MRAIRLVAVSVALALWAAACAGTTSGSENADTDPSTTALAATTSAAKTTVAAETTTAPPSSTVTSPLTSIAPNGSSVELTTAAEHPECTVPTGQGRQEGCIVDQGLVRKYLLQVPSSYDPSTPAPLVMYFHGGSGNMQGVLSTGLLREARERGWLAVSLQGTTIWNAAEYYWNGVHCCKGTVGVDDVEFARALVVDLEDALNIDPSRIYASGFSNGAMLVHRIGSEMSDVVAAIAPAAGTIGGASPSTAPTVTITPPPRPVPVMLMHGRQDGHVKFGGGVNFRDRLDLSFTDSVSFWAKANGCSPAPITTDESWGTQATFDGCPEHGEVVANAYDELGHDFPTVKKGSGVDGAIQVMDFFARQQLPVTPA